MSKPPQEERMICLQPATPYMDKGKRKMTPEEYEAERRSKKNVDKPPQEERIRLQPATPAALTPHLLHQASPSLAASAVSLPETPTPMEVLVEEALDESIDYSQSSWGYL